MERPFSFPSKHESLGNAGFSRRRRSAQTCVQMLTVASARGPRDGKPATPSRCLITRRDLVLLSIPPCESAGWLATLSNEMEIDLLLITSQARAEPPESSRLVVGHSSQHRRGGPAPGGFSEVSSSGAWALVFLRRPQGVCVCFQG